MSKSLNKERLVVILSDIEMSSGDIYDDFPHTSYLSNFLNKYNDEKYDHIEIDLVFNGDTFDFLKTDLDGKFPHLIDEEMAMSKLSRVESAHKLFFSAIEEFLDNGSRSRRVHFIVGNHDMELLFPKVQEQIINLCGGSGQIFFPGMELNIRDVHIQHGNQHDSLFMIDQSKCFIDHKGKKILNLPWASVTLLNVILPYREELHILDRIKPRDLIFEKIPDLKEFLLSKLWDYWTKDYIKDYLSSSDPLKKISWSMIKEAFKRSFLIFNSDVEVGEFFHKEMRRNHDLKTYVIGHVHDPHIWSFGDRKVIQSGCFRDEFMMGPDEKSYELIPKSYVEIKLKDNRVITSNLIEIQGPDIDKTRMPKSLKTYIPTIHKKLGPVEKRLQDKLNIEAQEEKEKRETEQEK